MMCSSVDTLVNTSTDSTIFMDTNKSTSSCHLF